MESVKGIVNSVTHPVSSLLHPKRTIKRQLGIGGWGGDKAAQDGPPTVDEAGQNQQVTDRIKRRRGVLANLFGGNTGGAPATAVKTLLGS